jgi:hypothetical protein
MFSSPFDISFLWGSKNKPQSPLQKPENAWDFNIIQLQTISTIKPTDYLSIEEGQLVVCNAETYFEKVKVWTERKYTNQNKLAITTHLTSFYMSLKEIVDKKLVEFTKIKLALADLRSQIQENTREKMQIATIISTKSLVSVTSTDYISDDSEPEQDAKLDPKSDPKSDTTTVDSKKASGEKKTSVRKESQRETQKERTQSETSTTIAQVEMALATNIEVEESVEIPPKSMSQQHSRKNSQQNLAEDNNNLALLCQSVETRGAQLKAAEAKIEASYTEIQSILIRVCSSLIDSIGGLMNIKEMYPAYRNIGVIVTYIKTDIVVAVIKSIKSYTDEISHTKNMSEFSC